MSAVCAALCATKHTTDSAAECKTYMDFIVAADHAAIKTACGLTNNTANETALGTAIDTAISAAHGSTDKATVRASSQ